MTDNEKKSILDLFLEPEPPIDWFRTVAWIAGIICLSISC